METNISPNVKICRVCGDKALGFNFNGLTCESCKSFFRRNALKYEKFKCRKEGHCVIDFVTRKCCTHCRLSKCFSIGMKRELICSKLDRECATGSTSSQSCDLDNQPSPSSSSSSSLSPHNLSNIERILESDIRTKMSQCSILYPSEYTLDNVPIPQQIPNTLELNATELEQIREVQHATNCAAFYDENRLQVIGEVTDLVYALNLAELYIKKTVRFCKSITAFKTLTQDIQLAILKSFFTELMIIRFAFVFNQDKDGYPVIEDDGRKQAVFIKLNLLYEAKKQNVLFYCRQYSCKFHDALEEDSVLRDLILALRLFLPRENQTTNQEFIRYQYFIYTRLLKRYLEHKYKDLEKAEEKVTELNAILSEMEPVKDILEGIFIQTDASQLALVLNEIYHFQHISS